MMESLLRAQWFDGRSSRAQPVLVSLVPGAGGPSVRWHPLASAQAPHERAFDGVEWPERFSLARAPRRVTLDLRDEGSLEFDDAHAWYEALAAAGARPTLAARMQSHWRVFALVAVVAVALLAAFYRWGTPWAAAQLARFVPLDWEVQLSRKAVASLDRVILKPSTLPPARQQQLREQFTAVAAQATPSLKRYANYAPALQLEFRRGLGPNAFALPGGFIVMTDELVERAGELRLADDALVGVLAHELGHVVHRHTTRMVVEQGVLNVALGLAMGDVSWVFANASTLLTALAYKRSHENEADCFALALMRQARLDRTPMADLLLDLGHAHDRHESEPAFANLLSTHPDTLQRAELLKRGDVQACR